MAKTILNRRLFLAISGLAASPLASAAKPLAARPRIGVVGGGIMGASIAMHCARAGAAVTLLEKTAPAAGCTSKSFAWINPFSSDPHYAALRWEAHESWRRLDRQLGMGVIWGGYINFTDREADRGRMAALSKLAAAQGHPTRALDLAALKTLSPRLQPGALVEATWSDLGGNVDAVHATGRFLAAAKAAGAKVLYPCPVTAIEPATGAGGQVTVVTPKGRLAFDRLVIAAGGDAPAMLAPLGYTLPLSRQLGQMVISRPMPPLTRIVHDGPGQLSWKQMADGAIVGMESTLPLPPPEGGAGSPDERVGRRIFSKLSVYMPELAAAQVGQVTLGDRAVPTDGMPVVGPTPGARGVYVCVANSGVCLSTALGAYMADELIAGREAPLLAPYRPNRALPPVKTT